MKSIKASKGRKLPRLITGPFEAKLQKKSITPIHMKYTSTSVAPARRSISFFSCISMKQGNYIHQVKEGSFTKNKVYNSSIGIVL
jgi:hypothetical protein